VSLRSLRVAVIGSGPAGVYAAAVLAERDMSVDVIDRLPTPFGLVRYGVAPDHEKMKSVAVALRMVLEGTTVRFLGNVELGWDISLDDLHRYYDAFLVASGAATDRRLGIEGEDLPGSFSATDFVSWYSGHPDPQDMFTLNAGTVAVIGVGNVAV
jgi:ferredoxin/flavodoxin---NADP+ reductase